MRTWLMRFVLQRLSQWCVGGVGANGRYITVGLDMDEDVVDAVYLADDETVVCCVQGAMVEGNQVDTLGCASTVAK